MSITRVIKIACAVDALLLALGGIVGLAGSRTVQLIDPYDAAQREITGKAGTPLGEPVNIFLLGDSKLIPQPEGEPWPYYDRRASYPFQMRTYWFIYVVAAGAMIAAWIAMLAVIRVISRRAAATSAQ